MGSVKHIIVLVSNDLTYDQRMQRTCRSLAGAGYEVLLLGRKRPRSVALTSDTFRQQRLNCFFDKGKLFYLFLNIRLFLFLIFQRVDVILAVDADTLLAASLAARLRGKKLVFDAHEYFTEVPELMGRPRTQSIWRRIENFGIPRAQLCYSVSDGVANMYGSRYGKTFHVIRNLPERWQPEDPVKKIPNSIIYQGALNEGRGLEEMISAMQHLDARLILAGDGDLTTELKEWAVEKGVAEKVAFKGYTNPAALRKLTPCATLGINLLEDKGLSYFHSLANKFFAYVQAGIPQVCINFPEYRKMNEEYEVALLVDDLNESGLAEMISGLLADKQLYERLRQNCLEARNHWHWENEEGKLLKLIGNL